MNVSSQKECEASIDSFDISLFVSDDLYHLMIFTVTEPNCQPTSPQLVRYADIRFLTVSLLWHACVGVCWSSSSTFKYLISWHSLFLSGVFNLSFLLSIYKSPAVHLCSPVGSDVFHYEDNGQLLIIFQTQLFSLSKHTHTHKKKPSKYWSLNTKDKLTAHYDNNLSIRKTNPRRPLTKFCSIATDCSQASVDTADISCLWEHVL